MSLDDRCPTPGNRSQSALIPRIGRYRLHVNARVNPPHLQTGPVAFAVICVLGIVLAVQKFAEFRIGTNPWWAAVLLLILVAFGFAFIVGGWLWIQREVAIADGTIVVRRWIEFLRGRPGRAIPIGPGTRIFVTRENVRTLLIESNGVTEARLTLGYWEPRTTRELIDRLRASRVEFAQYWEGDYPPGV